MILIGFILGFSFALGLIQLCYFINVQHTKKGAKLVSEGNALLSEKQRINKELLKLDLELNGNG